MPKIEEIQKKIKEKGLNSFFFISKANVFYMTYFNSTNAYIILTEKDKFFITDSRYYEGAKEKLKNWNVILLGEKDKKQPDHLRELLNELGGNKIGFEEDKMTISFYKKVVDGDKELEKRLTGYEGFLNDIRMIKTEDEINIIKEAVKKTDKIFKRILEEIKDLKTELNVRRRIINYIFEEGGTGESFPAIVASGEHSANPHYETSDYPILWDSPLLIDMGMKYKGYCSDFTRTVFLGNIDPEIEKIYQIVKEANITATEKVKEGVPVKEIDLAARKVIEKYGYGEYFTHSTGHGIGVEIHEEPRIYKNAEDILKENMVFTIEPGIYIPKKGGVRLENIVVVRKDKAEILTTTSLNPLSI
ncbi:M24 family metallopeptidase [Persephonella sp.]